MMSTKLLASFLLASILLLAGCSSNADLNDQVLSKRAERDSLKVERERINDAISHLEGWLAKNDPEQRRTLPMVTVLSLKRQPFEHWTEAHGSVKSDMNALIHSSTGGEVRRILVKQGQPVTKGQLIVDIDTDALQQNVRQADAAAKLATTVYDRQARLWAQKVGSEVQYLEAKSRRDGAMAQLTALREQLRAAQVIAPFNGVVDEIFPSVGDMAAPLQPVARVVALGESSIECDLAEDLLSRVNVGDSVEVHLPDTGERFAAAIGQVGQFINPNNRTFKVTLRLGGNLKLRPNQLVNVRIRDLVVPDALVVPARLVMENSTGQSYIYVLEEADGSTRSRKVFVKVLSTQGGELLLDGSSADLKGGELLIDQGSRLVVDKQEVQVMRGA